MSIHPIPEARHFDPVLRPDLREVYARRAARLRSLAPGHELAAWLGFAAAVTDAQKAAIGAPDAAGLDVVAIARSGDWLVGLALILEHVAEEVADQPELQTHLRDLSALGVDACKDAAVALAEGRFTDVDPAHAPLIWAALSLHVAQIARLMPLPPKGDAETVDCPVCGTAPVASHIHTGDLQGLRYLHCAMCECEWHMVRAKCSCCGDASDLDYLSFDTPEAATRAEACNVCKGYLKIVSAERDQDVEAVADDLQIALDDAAQAEGFGRTGFNPFALPG